MLSALCCCAAKPKLTGSAIDDLYCLYSSSVCLMVVAAAFVSYCARPGCGSSPIILNTQCPRIALQQRSLVAQATPLHLEVGQDQMPGQPLHRPLLGAQGRMQQPLPPVPVSVSLTPVRQEGTFCSLSLLLPPPLGVSPPLFLGVPWRMRTTHASSVWRLQFKPASCTAPGIASSCNSSGCVCSVDGSKQCKTLLMAPGCAYL